MNPTLLSFAIVPALAAPLLFTTTATPAAQSGGLVRVEAQDPSPRSAPDLSAWKDRLTARDLDRREEAYGDFVEALRRDPSLRRAAEDWRSDSNADLAWTSRLALREAADARGGSRSRSPFSAPGIDQNDLRSRLDDMQRRFGDLDQMFEDFERRLNQSPRGTGPNTHLFAPHGLTREGQSYSLRFMPDGVKVEIEENVGGNREKKTYTAPTLEELYEKHPELRDKLQGHVQIFNSPHGSMPGFDDDAFNGLFVPRSGGGTRSFTPFSSGDALRTDRLGVGVEDPTADDRKHGHIEDGVGLKVMTIESNSIAQRLGIEVGDVIVDVNGRTIRAVPDVIDVLAQRKLDQDVVVTLVDAGGKKRTLTWKAAAVSADRSVEKRKKL